MIKDEKNVNTKEALEAKEKPAEENEKVSGPQRKFSDKGRGRRGFGAKKFGSRQEKKDEFEQRILDIARVTRVMAGGKRMRFRACVAIGDKKGRVGVGVGKGLDVTLAVNKAVNRAKKEMIEVPIYKDTIPHRVYNKYCAGKMLIKPAGKGRGVVAGSVARVIFELAGVRNVTSKSLGSNNKLSRSRCVIEALKKLKKIEIKTDDKNKKEESGKEKSDKK